MNLMTIWEKITGDVGMTTFVVIVILSLIQIAPLKINPWSYIGKIIGKFLGVTAISEKLNALEEKVDENQATTIRVRILRFEDELQGGKRHSKDSWDQVMDDIERYERYTIEHPCFKNEITVASINHIRSGYSERLEKRDFTI